MSTITEPCVRYDLDETEYHNDAIDGGSLSVTHAKKLLIPGGPARYQWELHNRKDRPEFEFGRAAHEAILGVGASWVESPYPDFRSKEAREWRDVQRDAGITPISAKDAQVIRDMADAIHAHAGAMKALSGTPEVSMFQKLDDVVWLRGRADVLGDGFIADYKTTAGLASPDEFTRTTTRNGYHIQAAHYIDLANSLDLDISRFVFIVQEKEPPYLPGVCRLSEDFLSIGRDLMARAVEVYRECMIAGIWPGLPDEEVVISPPAWLVSQHYSTLDPALEAELLALGGVA